MPRPSLLTVLIVAFVLLEGNSAPIEAQQDTSGSASSSDRAPIAITDVSVLPMTGDTVLRNQTVLIRGNRIAALGVTGSIAVPPGARVIDGRDRHLLPGFWDMHVHAVGTVQETESWEHRVDLLLANGVTGVRDMGSELDTLLAVRARIAEGGRLAPRLFAAGPLLDGPPQRWSIPFAWHLETREQALQAMDSLGSAGVDFLKIYGGLPRGAYFTLAEEAGRRGVPFAGHVPFSISAAEASDAGQSSIEHAFLDLFTACVPDGTSRIFQILGVWGDEGFGAYYAASSDYLDARDPECVSHLYARFQANDTWIVPTTVNTIKDARALDRAAFQYLGAAGRDACEGTVEMIEAADPAVRDSFYSRFLADIGQMHEEGVSLLAGTDLGNACLGAGFSLHDELEHLVEAGLGTYEALRTTTANPARYLGLSDSLGFVQPGMLADLVLLDANPLIDIRNTRRVVGVAVDGQWLDHSALEEMLNRAASRVAGKER